MTLTYAKLHIQRFLNVYSTWKEIEWGDERLELRTLNMHNIIGRLDGNEKSVLLVKMAQDTVSSYMYSLDVSPQLSDHMYCVPFTRITR